MVLFDYAYRRVCIVMYMRGKVSVTECKFYHHGSNTVFSYNCIDRKHFPEKLIMLELHRAIFCYRILHTKQKSISSDTAIAILFNH